MKFPRLILAAVALVTAPLAMAATTPPDSGLLITRTNSQQWEIRLMSGSQGQQFSGVIESDLPFTAVSRMKLEATDSATLTTPTTLAVNLAIRPGGLDGVDFSVSANAKLCIRDSGGAAVPLYLGDSIATGVPVTAPLALTSADACGAVAPPTVSAGGRKYHAGHYIVMGKGAATQALMTTAIKPGVVGVMKRYTWRSLEPSQGVYNFAEIKSDLVWAAANGMRLIAMIEDKTFTKEKDGPAYLDSYEIWHAPDGVAQGGYVMKRWDPVVVARFNALVKALGAQVDSNKNFEGISMQESSLSMSPAALKTIGYTPEKYRDALINILTSASASLPTSRVFWLMNFLTGNQAYIANIANAVASKGVIMGGPDVWPDNKALQSRVYPYYAQFAGKMPLFGQVENVNYSEPHMTSGYKTKYWTMLELYNYALTKLHVNYMFWVRITKPATAPGYDWGDALPVIAAHPNLN